MKHLHSSHLPKLRWQVTAALAFMSMITPIISEPAHPDWWSDGDPPVVDPSAELNNFAPVNAGQAKWVVSEALRALDSVAPGVAFEIRSDLQGTPPNYLDQIVDLTIPNPQSAAWIESQKKMLTLGQLKAIALPFYNHLNEGDALWVESQIQLNHSGAATLNQDYWQVSGNAHHTEGGYFPWNPSSPVAVNNAAANIGQLKAVFSLRFDALPASILNFDTDEMLDSWEQLIVDYDLTDAITKVGDVLANDDFDGDGFSNEAEFLAGTDATDPTDTPSGSVEIPDTGDLVQLRVFTPLF